MMPVMFHINAQSYKCCFGQSVCGITGFVDSSLSSLSPHTINAMTWAIAHRGPDDSGSWLQEKFGIAFGHTRLSIVDLSPLGHQPMASISSRFVMVFNGEIYNFQELSRTLTKLGHTFRGHSDTEVMLAAFEEWGIPASVEKFIGMFACAVWDEKCQLLYLIRDRIGKKPLYYGWHAGLFLFGSELKSILAHPKCTPEIDRDALDKMLRLGYVPTPWSIYKNIYKLVPGTILVIPPERFATQSSDFSQFPDEITKSFKPQRYWSLAQVARQGVANPFEGTEEEAAQELEKLLTDAVGIRMIADVPLGAFLSGGIDSSAVVALMQTQSSRPVRTFSIGFNEKEYNEAVHARVVAEHLGTEHTELYLSPEDAINVVPLLPQIYDEPFGDSSQIPTYLVSKICREHVAVGLSGDGGDELFCGYERYAWAERAWSMLRYLPNSPKNSFAKYLNSQSDSFYDKWSSRLSPFLPKSLHFHNPAHKAYTLGRILKFENRAQFYQGMMSHWSADDSLVKGVGRDGVINGARTQRPEMPNFLSEMMYVDMETYLPDDILVKVDRASMAVALETRAPLLDHRVIEFSGRIPVKFKTDATLTKKVLRRIVHRFVPKSMVERPKMGFAVPIDRWLRSELRDWAENLISTTKLEEQGYLNPAPIRNRWAQHLSGAHRWEHSLWNVLMFQAWLEDQSRPKAKL